MKKRSKGINRLSILCGGLLSLGFLLVITTQDAFKKKEEAIVGLVFCVLVFLIVWGIIRGTYWAIYWVYSGFKGDRENQKWEKLIP